MPLQPGTQHDSYAWICYVRCFGQGLRTGPELRSWRGVIQRQEGLFLQKMDMHWHVPFLELSVLVLFCLLPL